MIWYIYRIIYVILPSFFYSAAKILDLSVKSFFPYIIVPHVFIMDQ